MRRLRLSYQRRLLSSPWQTALHNHRTPLLRQIMRDAVEALSAKPLSSISLCFSGHRIIRHRDMCWLPQRLDDVLEACYQRGYIRYICGGAIGFDMLAAEAVLRLQAQHPDVELIHCLPCSDQSARWSESQRERYEKLLYHTHEVQVLSSAYYDGCMHARNHCMVDQSSLCLYYLYVKKGGTASTVQYATLRGIPVLNIADEMSCAAFITGGSITSSDTFSNGR